MQCSKLPKRPGPTHFSPHAFQFMYNAVRHSQTMPLQGALLETSTVTTKWLIIYAGRRVTSQAVLEATENTGMGRRHEKRSMLDKAVWDPSSSADLGSFQNFRTLVRRWCSASVTYYPSLFKPFLLATCHLQEEKSDHPHPPRPKTKVLLVPVLQP